MDQINNFIQSLHQFWLELSTYLPKLLAALVLVVIGWLVAKLIRRGTIRFFKLIKLDVVSEKAGIEDILIQGGVQYTAVTILANLIYWFILFTVLLAVMNSLGFQAAAEIFNRVILFLPNIFVSVLLLIFGSLFARFIRGTINTYLNNIGVVGAELISSIAYWAVMAFIIFIALEQLSIGGQILTSAFQIAFGALCLALALAFGLGGREWAARILEKMWKNKS